MIDPLALIIRTWCLVVVCYRCILKLVFLKINFARCNRARCRCRCIGAYPILKIPGGRPRNNIVIKLYGRPFVQRHPLGAARTGHPCGGVVDADISPVKALHGGVIGMEHRIPGVDTAPEDELHLLKVRNASRRAVLRRHLQRIALRMVCRRRPRLAAVSTVYICVAVHSMNRRPC